MKQEVLEKVCNTCKETKPISDFHMRGDGYGPRHECKECHRESMRDPSAVAARNLQFAHEQDSRTKICSKCLKIKNFSEFSKQKNGKHGLKSHCRTCNAAYDKEKNARKPKVKEIETENQRADRIAKAKDLISQLPPEKRTVKYIKLGRQESGKDAEIAKRLFNAFYNGGKLNEIADYLERENYDLKSMTHFEFEDFVWKIINENPGMGYLDFHHEYGSVLQEVVKRGYEPEDDFGLWRKYMRKGGWDRTKILDISQNYSNYTTFKNEQPRAYRAALSLSIAHELDLEYDREFPGFWNEEEIKRAIDECDSVNTLMTNYKSVYWIITSRGLMHLIEHLPRFGSLVKRFVYRIDASDGSFYFGLCISPTKRWDAHQKDARSSVHGKLKEHGGTFTLLTSQAIDAEDAVNLERKLISDHWGDPMLLNRAPGGALGGKSISRIRMMYLKKE